MFFVYYFKEINFMRFFVCSFNQAASILPTKCLENDHCNAHAIGPHMLSDPC